MIVLGPLCNIGTSGLALSGLRLLPCVFPVLAPWALLCRPFGANFATETWLVRFFAVAALPALIGFPCLAAQRQVEVVREVYLMGTRCSLTTLAEDRQRGLEQIEKQLQILEEAEDQLSTWRPDSLLSQLNRQPPGTPFQAPPSLCRLIGQLRYWVTETGGSFDPAIGALVRAWGLREGGRTASSRDLESALEESGFARFNFEPSSCRIVRENDVSIDCGAFGKGEALDRLLVFAATHSQQPWLVDLGGQVAVCGHPAESAFWRLDLAHPGKRTRPVLSVNIRSGSLSTSGGSERDLQVAGRRVGHILDPHTGLSAAFRGSVAVWHERALAADILSTALYVMGPDKGRTWAEARNVAACFFLLPGEGNKIQEEVTILRTTAFVRRCLRMSNK